MKHNKSHGTRAMCQNSLGYRPMRLLEPWGTPFLRIELAETAEVCEDRGAATCVNVLVNCPELKCSPTETVHSMPRLPHITFTKDKWNNAISYLQHTHRSVRARFMIFIYKIVCTYMLRDLSAVTRGETQTINSADDTWASSNQPQIPLTLKILGLSHVTSSKYATSIRKNSVQ